MAWPAQGFKGEKLNCRCSTEGSLISASEVTHCGIYAHFVLMLSGHAKTAAKFTRKASKILCGAWLAERD